MFRVLVMTPNKVKLKVYIKISTPIINRMKPPQSLVQGKPAYKLNGSYGRPQLGMDGSGETPAGTKLVLDKALNKVTKEYIPSLQKQMGINDNSWELSLGCRSVNDLRRVYRGNGLFFNKSLLNATPIRPLSRQAFSADRVGTFGANFKQTVEVAPSTYFGMN
tara:strand:- start:163 stop:651 length:489 start_codon:yes stop_codon:yes gene_type:complete